ncbi:site-specific integrase [Fodinibius salsisoli]|uniref:Site-specific integrase n=1 Tax=Fodinibius salsisoli TaxID=2820877 RepID=A0ABT3PH18_9BACT|nr:site-specific integrase [Fodinibius salsisoli]MCW9705216.1 site-specific integrase [Fodinibius salsisoli]
MEETKITYRNPYPMSATFKGTLKKDKRKSNLEYPVYLRITYNRNNRYYHLGFSVLETDWKQKTGRVKSKHYSSEVFNNRIERAEHKGQVAFFELEDEIGRENITAKMILDRMHGKNHNDFFEYAEKRIKRLKNNDQVSQRKQHRTVVNKLKHFTKSEVLPFEKITLQFVNDFEDFLSTKYDNAVNTIHANLKIFRRILNYAIKEDLMAFEDNPFHKKKLKKERTEKTKLSLDEIKAIHSVEAEKGTRIFDAKNLFLFSFYCAGIRFSDVANLKWNNIKDSTLSYTMDKTGKTKTIPLVMQAIDILNHYGYKSNNNNSDHYLFPLLDNNDDYTDFAYQKRQIGSKNALINKYLKKVAKSADINKNVSFHIARHSFADYARKSKMDLYTISKALGHSNLQTTEKYLKNFDQDGLTEEMNQLFN